MKNDKTCRYEYEGDIYLVSKKSFYTQDDTEYIPESARDNTDKAVYFLAYEIEADEIRVLVDYYRNGNTWTIIRNTGIFRDELVGALVGDVFIRSGNQFMSQKPVRGPYHFGMTDVSGVSEYDPTVTFFRKNTENSSELENESLRDFNGKVPYYIGVDQICQFLQMEYFGEILCQSHLTVYQMDYTDRSNPPQLSETYRGQTRLLDLQVDEDVNSVIIMGEINMAKALSEFVISGLRETNGNKLVRCGGETLRVRGTCPLGRPLAHGLETSARMDYFKNGVAIDWKVSGVN